MNGIKGMANGKGLRSNWITCPTGIHSLDFIYRNRGPLGLARHKEWAMLTIQNNGAELVSTNYWETDHAKKGLLYMSWNAGTLRLLVPQSSESLLGEMRTGKSATLEPSLQNSQCVDLVFEDGSESPFFVAIDRRQSDRAIGKPGKTTLTVYTKEGKSFALPLQIKSIKC